MTRRTLALVIAAAFLSGVLPVVLPIRWEVGAVIVAALIGYVVGRQVSLARYRLLRRGRRTGRLP